MNWITVLLHLMGVEPRSPSTAYNFWSGFGSDLGEVAIFSAALHYLRSKNCAVKGCWRHGKYKVGDGTHSSCHRHHPEEIPRRITMEHLYGWHHRHHGDRANYKPQ